MKGSQSLEDLESAATKVLNQPGPPPTDHLTQRVIQDIARYNWQLDRRTETLYRDAFEKTSHILHRIANEPSVGLHHITEHVHSKGVPRVVGMRMRLQEVAKDADAALYDVNDSIRTVRGMQELVAFKNTKDALARSIALVEAISGAAPLPSTATTTETVTGGEPPRAGGDITFKSF